MDAARRCQCRYRQRTVLSLLPIPIFTATNLNFIRLLLSRQTEEHRIKDQITNKKEIWGHALILRSPTCCFPVLIDTSPPPSPSPQNSIRSAEK